MRLEDAIHQPHFRSSQERAHINIIYTASFLSQQMTQVLRPHAISMQQFNILRILKGLKGQPATVKLLTERMLDKMSNASRLVEKLKQKGYVTRQECEFDRRRVDIFITEDGIQLINKASEDLDQIMQSHHENINTKEAAVLSDLLDKMRS